MTNLPLPRFVFVIDTDTYAGNFERELCAFCTGSYGECGVGDDLGNDFKAEFPDEAKAFDDIVVKVADEHGCSRPVSIWPTIGRFNDGLGNCWDDGSDLERVMAKYMASVHATYDPWIAQALAKLEAGNADSQRIVDIHRRSIAEREASGPGKHFAYESVGIYFNERPTAEQIVFMKERAQLFADDPLNKYIEPFKIKGFALVEAEVKQTRVEL